MPDDRSPLDRLQGQIEHLPDHPSGLVELGHALAGQLGADKEEGCAACQEALPDYIEAELSGQPARRLHPDLARHLDLCPDCEEVYVDLLEIALEAEAEPLPVPVPLSAPDFSFLPSLTPAERMRQVVEPLVEEMLRRLDPGSVADLPAASRAFFQRLDELGTGAQIQPGLAHALAFGPDLPPALRSLAAAYTATVEIVRALPIEKLETELSSSRPSPVLRKHAYSAMRELGMGRREAKRWAEMYAAQAQDQAADFLDLARHIAKDA